MNKIHIAELIRRDYTTINIQFSDKEIYTYKILKKRAGDYVVGGYALVPIGEPKVNLSPVVTQVQRNGAEAFLKAHRIVDDEVVTTALPRVRAGIVAEIHAEPVIDFDLSVSYKWAIASIHLEDYNQLIAQDKDLIEKFKVLQIERSRRSAREAFLAEYPEILTLTNGMD